MSKQTEQTPQWDRKDEWRKKGENFLVTITRTHRSSFDESEGSNSWAVYAYIYPKHPSFSKFEGQKLWQEATQAMPLHGGASFLEYPMYEGKVTSVKVGADYHHLYDDFTHCTTQEDAYEIFNDAARLFVWLKNKADIATGETT